MSKYRKFAGQFFGKPERIWSCRLGGDGMPYWTNTMPCRELTDEELEEEYPMILDDIAPHDWLVENRPKYGSFLTNLFMGLKEVEANMPRSSTG